MAEERALRAEVELLRLEIELRRKEVALAMLEASRNRQADASNSSTSPYNATVETPTEPPVKRSRTCDDTSPQRTICSSFEVPPYPKQVQSVEPALQCPSQPGMPTSGPAPRLTYKRRKDVLWQKVQEMQTMLQTGPLTKAVMKDCIINQFVNFTSNAPCKEISEVLAYMYRTFLNRLKLEMQQGSNVALWNIRDEILAFFEMGLRCRKNARDQGDLLLYYMDVVRLLPPLPQDPPSDLAPLAGCWLRPTLVLGSGLLNGYHTQQFIVPDNLAPHDLFVEFGWEKDMCTQKPKRFTDANLTYMKMTISILQSCDFSTFRPSKGKMKAPPVLVVCDNQLSTVKLWRSLDEVARFEYGLGYRGAEAIFQEKMVLSKDPVSILVCSCTQLCRELKKGWFSFAAVQLLVFVGQQTLPQEFSHIRSKAPANVRTFVFLSYPQTPKNIHKFASQLLRNDAWKLSWAADSGSLLVVEPFIGDIVSPQPCDMGSEHIMPAPSYESLVLAYDASPTSESRSEPEHSEPQPIPARSTPDIMDFGSRDLNDSIVELLTKQNITQANPWQRQVVSEMMTGESRIFVAPEGAGTVLGFVVPTVHLALNYLPDASQTRVIVLAPCIGDVERIAGEYSRFVKGLPEAGLAVERLHPQRLSAAAVPFNSSASIIVGTPAKVAQAINQEIAARVDPTGVDVLILYHTNIKPWLKDAEMVQKAILRAQGVVQVVAFFHPRDVEAVRQVQEMCPDATIVNFTPT